MAELMARFTAPTPVRHLSESLDEVMARRAAFLAEYQDEAYAERYRALIGRVRAAEERIVANATALTDAVARGLFKLMAYKDEYEVARLYTDGNFAKQMAATFEGEGHRLQFHLAPPLLARKDPATGVPRKMTFGPWLMGVFGVLAKGKRLRGTPFDVFGYTHERRTERRLVRDYEALVEELIAKLTPQNHSTAVGLAALAQKIRGFGHIKARNLEIARREEGELLVRFRQGEAGLPMAAE
jgi:indolepyruvate ferredoxin oxidoreductase